MTENKFLIDMGRRITSRRKELHMTQEQVAEKMNVSLQSVSCFELGKKAIRPENLVNLCTVLRVTPNYVLIGDMDEHLIDEFQCKLAALSERDREIIKKMVACMSEDRL